MCSEGCLHASMEPLHKTIYMGIVSNSLIQLGSEEVREILPELGVNWGPRSEETLRGGHNK